MRPLALAFLLLLSGCAAGSKVPASSVAPKVVATPTWDYFPRSEKPSPLMEPVLTRLRERRAFAALDSWTRLPELPAWASLASVKSGECEIAASRRAQVVMDAFDYMVIVGKNRRTIVIRSGGFAGVYQIFEEKAPKKTREPTT
jgi:hypothetical protein